MMVEISGEHSFTDLLIVRNRSRGICLIRIKVNNIGNANKTKSNTLARHYNLRWIDGSTKRENVKRFGG